MKLRLSYYLIKLQLKLFRMLNRNKPHVLIYTDSRGFNVTNKNGRILMRDSYVFELCKQYRVDFYLCPEKHTTIVDFLEKYQKLDHSRYAAVIMHCGIVDFSPRPMSNIAFIGNYKAGIPVFAEMFERNKAYHENPFEVLYAGEPTSTIYSPDYFTQFVVPRLEQIKNLIWINSNHFIPGWEGNYGKDRPANIDEVVSHFDQLLMPHIKHLIDIKHWNEAQIRRYTVDNIHFTREGFLHIATLLKEKLKELHA